MELKGIPNLTKRDLVILISNETKIAQYRVSKIIDRTLDLVMDSIAHGQVIEFRNFGVFKPRHRRARIGRNPHQPKHAILISPRTVVQFKAGKILETKVMNLLNTLSKSEATHPASRTSSILQRVR